MHFKRRLTAAGSSNMPPSHLYICWRSALLSFSTQSRQTNWTRLSAQSIGFFSVHTAQNVVSVCGTSGCGIAVRLPKLVGEIASLSKIESVRESEARPASATFCPRKRMTSSFVSRSCCKNTSSGFRKFNCSRFSSSMASIFVKSPPPNSV